MATVFNYIFQPSQAFVATSTSLTLTIENPLTGNPVTFAGGPKGDEIDIVFPVGDADTDLVNALQFDATCNTQGFSCARTAAGDYFAVKSPTGATLTPGSQIVIVFSPVVVNGVTGQATVQIREYIGSSENDTGVAINKLKQELAVIAWLEPWTVGQNQQSTLFWQSMSATSVQVSGFADGTGTKTFPVSGNPPYPGNTQVSVLPTESQRTYTLVAYAGTKPSLPAPVTLTQHSPLITSYNSDRTGTIGVMDTVNLSWTLLFAASHTLQTPLVQPLRNPLSPYPVIPGQDLALAYKGNYASMPGIASYMLTAYGYQDDPDQTLSFQLAPVQLAFFKFRDKDNSGKLSGIVYQTNPASWRPTQLDMESPTLNILTIYQPGPASNVYYLGSGDTVNPQIQYFNAQDDGKGQYIFSWVTANLNTLVLNPGAIQIAPANIQDGTQTLSLTAAQYILTGTGNNGDTIISVLDVPYKPSRIKPAILHDTVAEAFNDPQCTIIMMQGGAIPDYYRPSDKNIQDATNAVTRLTFNDIWRVPPWRLKEESVRLDVKGAIPGGGRNWLIQVNGIKGNSTISAITVQGNLATASTPERKNYVTAMVRSALLSSLCYGAVEDLNGPCK